MQTPELFAEGFRYHAAMIDRLLLLAAELPKEQSHAPTNFGRSMHELFIHILRVDTIWRLLSATPAAVPPPPPDLGDPAALRDAFAHESAAMQAHLATLDAAAIGAVLAVRSPRGDMHQLPRWKMLMQRLLHGQQHRAEIAQLLTEAGQSPGDLDIIFFQ